MTIAEIHGKSPLTTSEDMLTANVFTAFRYLPADRGIIGFLRSIKGVAGVIPQPQETATVDYFFWPLGQTREPDVLLELLIDGKRYHVVVEAKYLSGASDREIEEIEHEAETILWGNQLADQLRELNAGEYVVWHKGRRSHNKRLKSRVTDRLLLYLTAHPARPRGTLQTSAKLYPPGAARLFWTSWYQVSDYLHRQQDALQTFPYDRVIADIRLLLALKQFTTFRGIRPLPTLSVEKRQGRFWTGRDTRLPTFAGIEKPPYLALAAGNGGFWKV